MEYLADTKVKRKMDELGRVVIPSEMRRKLELIEESIVGIELKDDKIILTKAMPECILCHSSENELTEINMALLCSVCINKIKSIQ